MHAIIEPFALLGCLVTLYLAIILHRRPARVYVPVVGLAAGLTLLTKEISIFVLLTPVIHAMLLRNWRTIAKASAGVTVVEGRKFPVVAADPRAKKLPKPFVGALVPPGKVARERAVERVKRIFTQPSQSPNVPDKGDYKKRGKKH